MSALIGVCKRESIDLLTDAASVSEDDGIVTEIQPKQFVWTAPPQTVIATTGWAPPCQAFAVLARERCANFDGLLGQARELWAETRAMVPAHRLGVSYGVLLAGWSEQRRRLELYELNAAEPPALEDLAVAAIGPTDEAGSATRRFVQRFAHDPEAFDAHRDGLALMKQLRGFHRQFQRARHACVGGFAQHTRVAVSGTTTRIIHRWPDVVGQPIEEAA